MKQRFFANLKDPALQKAAQLAVVLHRRPSEILKLKGDELWLLEVDYQLVMNALEKASSSNQDETVQEKTRKIKEWKNGKS